jgi:hypothetical protein
MRWMHRVRLYPTAAHERRLWFMLDLTRQTYNALLDERRYAWTARRISVTSKLRRTSVVAPLTTGVARREARVLGEDRSTELRAAIRQ